MDKRHSTYLPDLGKLPPQAINCEEAVLGIMLIYPDAVNDVVSILTPESFYKEANKRIYSAILDVYKAYGSADIITVSQKLRANGDLDMVGGPVYLSEISGMIVSSSQLEYYATIIKQQFIRRELIRHSTELQARAYDESIELAELIEYAESDLFKISDNTRSKEPARLGKFIDSLLCKIQQIINHEIKLIGKPSGLIDLDRMTGGFKDGEFIIIGARPSVGKSATGLQIAINCGMQNIPVGIFSLEMSSESIAQRSLSGVSDKTNVQLLQGECNIDDLVRVSEGIVNLPIFIDDTSGATVMEIRSKARKLILQHGIKMIIIDYLQLMRGDGDSREQEVASVSRGLKGIAKDLNIPVIALSQLSRKVEERSDKRPLLSDLRESGAIEQDADVVIFLYRASLYGQVSVIIDGSEYDASDKLELILAKNRNGAVGSTFAKHNKALTVISDLNKPINEPSF